MPQRDLIVVGGSAGSLSPLITLVQGLPPSLQSCVLIVVHSTPDGPGYLARILGRVSHLPVLIAREGQSVQPGVFVAPPDHHLIVTPGTMHVTMGPKENGFRPAIDPLFRTAAYAYESRVIGVVLSGALDDGSYGLTEIKAKHGLAIVQDPDEAEIPTMPRNAIAHVVVDYVLPAAAIAPLLCREARVPLSEGDVAMGGSNSEDPQIPGVKTDITRMNADLGPPSGLTCPDCGGALWQVEQKELVRFQCHVGHHYSPESLSVQQADRVEVALWTAVRALEERADLRRRLASQTAGAGLAKVSEGFATQASEAKQQADQIRELLADWERRARDPEVEVAELRTRGKRLLER
jgi:two-component system, chemotaxis family, protein-glutamate methylesterase/glutaminase